MSEPIQLFKGDLVQVVFAPSVARELVKDGWSQTAPVAVEPDPATEPAVEEPAPASKPARKRKGKL